MKYIKSSAKERKEWNKLVGKTIKSTLLQEIDLCDDETNVIQVITIEFTDDSKYTIVGESGCTEQYAQCQLFTEREWNKLLSFYEEESEDEDFEE